MKSQSRGERLRALASPVRNAVIAAAVFGLAAPVIGPYLSLTRPALAQTADVTVENVSLKLGWAVVTIPMLKAEGSTLSSAELKALLEGTTADYAATLSRLDATRITIPTMTVDQEVLGVKSRITYTNLVSEGIARGRVAKMTTGEMLMTSELPPELANSPEAAMSMTDGKIARSSATDVDLTLLARVMTEKQTAPDQPLGTIYGAYDAEDYVMASKVMQFSIAKMSGTGFRARPMVVPFTQLLAALPKMPKPPAEGQLPEPLPPEAMKPLMQMMTSIYKDMAFDAFEMTGFKISPKAEAAPGLMPVEFTLDRFGMQGMADAKLKEFSYEGLKVDMPGGAVKLGKVMMRDLDINAMLGFMTKMAEQPMNDPAALEAFMATLDPRDYMPSLGQFLISGLDVDIPDQMRPGERTKMSLGLFDLQASNWLRSIPTKLAMTLDKFSVDLPKDDPATAELRAAGISTLTLSSKVALGWDEPTKEIAIDAVSVDAGQLGAATITGRLGNIPREVFEGDMFMAQAALMSANVKSLGIDVNNGGLVEMALQQSAKDQGLSVEELKGTAIAGISVGLPMALGGGEPAKKLAEALAKFLANPKTLKVKADAPNGFGMADMMEPDKIAEKLNVQATANE